MANDSTGPGSPVVEGMGAQGKYAHLEVPNFNNASSPAEAMTSYLHLGAVRDPRIAASPDAPPSTGEDLASLVTTFIDDTRVRDGCPDFIPEAERQAVTAKLHTLGGWRDHSDGNRITTTRGDKVEIIKGNYRMVVLGRQDTDVDEASVDISGGHISEGGITFDGSSSIEYTTEDYGGTWVVVENTRKGHVHTAYHGKVFEFYTGEIVESITGTESPSAQMANPVVTNRTWAESISSYTGSAALPVPTMLDETWATTITSTTNATTMTDTTVATSMTSTTTCPSITSTTTGNQTITTTGDQTITTTGDTTSTTIGNSLSTTIGNTLDTLVGTSTSLQVGAQTQLLVGNMAQLTVGGMENLTVGLVFDLIIAGKIDINVAGGLKFTADGMIEVNPFCKDEISELKQEIAQIRGAIATVSNHVCLFEEHVSGQFSVV